jgi:hypothetical protein
MRRLRSIAALLAYVSVGASASVAIAGERVAPLLPQMRPQAAPELRDRFHEAVARGLAGGSDEIVPAAEVRMRLGSSDEMLACSGTGACVARSAQALRADKLVATEVDISGKTYAIKMRAVDAVGRELVKVDEACDICNVKEADEAVARAATKLATAVRALPPEATAKPPEPKEEATAKPPQPPKADEPISRVEPTPEPLPTPALSAKPVEKKLPPWRPLAISAAVAGVVGLAVGISLLAIDGNPTCGKPDATHSCPEVYNTTGAGATLLTLGVLSGAASGVFFYLDHRARKKSQVAVIAVPMLSGGAFVSASGRF